MELSTYFNMDYFHESTPYSSQLYDEGTPAQPPQQQQQRLVAYNNPLESFFFLPNTTFDSDPSYFDQSSFLYPAEIYPRNDHTLLDCASNDNILPLEEDYNLIPFPKRQKCFHHDNSSNYFLPTNLFDGFVPNPSFNFPSPDELACPLQASQHFATMQGEFKVPQLSSQVATFGVSDDFGDDSTHRSNEKTSISPQSLAARERRRKIAEKTQELGELVPGGSKMNTAEMLNAAGKYVKYLQAQVEMFQLMNTIQEEEATPSIDENLQALLLFPSFQEKMYSEEKCFVPKDFVTTLINHDNLRSSPSILKDLTKLIATSDIKIKAKQE